MIQEAIRRDQSLKMQLANQVWRFGPSAIFLEGVPFSLRGGRMYAKRLVRLFSALYKQRENQLNERIEMAEFGPGLGFLSLHVLDILKEELPDIYARTTLHLVDPHQDMLDPLKSSTAFSRHANHVSFIQKDATKLDKGWASLSFAFSSNLIDSLAQRHIKVKNGAIYETCVQTAIKKDAKILDTTNSIPTVEGATYIQGVLETPGSIETMELSLAARIIDTLEETFVDVPLADCSDISDEQKKTLERHVSDLSAQYGMSDFSFNYSPEFSGHIASVLDNLSPSGGYVLSDFGFANQLVDYQPSHFLTSYGVSQFYSVCFPLLKHVVTECGGHSQITNHDLDETQDFLITKQPVTSAVGDVFKSQFEAFDFKDVSTKMEAIFTDTESDTSQKVDRLMDALSQDEKEDYYFLKTIGFQLFAEKHNNRAMDFAKKIIEKHQDLGVDGFLLEGWVLQEENKHEDAVVCFDRVLAFCPKHAVAHASKGLSHMVLGKNTEACHNFKMGIRYSHSNNIWQWVFGLSLCLKKLGNEDEAAQWLAFPLSIDSAEIIHPALKQQFAQSAT